MSITDKAVVLQKKRRGKTIVSNFLKKRKINMVNKQERRLQFYKMGFE
jgi:hypothetical protein